MFENISKNISIKKYQHTIKLGTAAKHKIKIDNENATEESTKNIMSIRSYLFSDFFPLYSCTFCIQMFFDLFSIEYLKVTPFVLLHDRMLSNE